MGTLVSSLTKAQVSTLFSISEWILLVSTIILVTGIIGEAKTPWWRRRHDLYVFLVALGCVGEFFGEAGMFVFSRGLQTLEEAEISRANTLAGNAANNATRAENAADKAEIISSKAGTSAEAALRKADSARKDVREASERLARLRTDAQAVEAEANKTKSDLVNLAVCNAPRVITPWEIGHGNRISGGWSMGSKDGRLGKTYVDSLISMAGQVVFIEYIADAEARRAAFNIVRTLKDAKWNVQMPPKVVDWVEDGVSVQPSMSFPANEAIRYMPEYWRTGEIADKFVDFLHAYNWQARTDWPTDAHGLIRDPKILPLGAIRIQVGLYPPSVYISPPGQQEVKTRLEEFKREQERLNAESERRWQEHLKAVPPEYRKRMEEERREARIKIKNIMSNGPCQVLNLPF